MKKTMFFVLLAFCFTGCKKSETGPAGSVKESTDKRPLAHASATPFTIVIVPDTQYETEGSGGATNQMMIDKMDWIIQNKVNENIAFVAGVGDIVDAGSQSSDWDFAKAQYHRLTTAGVRWGAAVGNHDQWPLEDPRTTSTSNYNARFGRNTYFHDKSWYGGNLLGAGDNNNDNYYCLFSQSGSILS